MRTSFYIALIIIVFACTSDNVLEPSLEGEWTLVSAMRKNKITTSLDGAYMKFTKDSLYTNILQEEVPSLYTKTGDQFTQISPGFGEIYYNIQSISDTTVTLNTKIRGVNFRFNFEKSK